MAAAVPGAPIAEVAAAPRRLAALAALLLALLPAVTAAQGYPQLHVVALSQRVDRTSVEPGGVFHVTIHVKITQRRDRLDELILGSFENCEIISNETVRTALPDGTDFVERLAVQALAPGEATISPAYIDALDPQLGKAMRFSSNAVRVEVRGSSRWLAISIRRLLLAVAIVAGLFAAAFVLFVIFVRRRKARPAAAPPPLDSRAAPQSAPRDRLVRAADAYRRERSAAALAEVRALLFTLAGVAPGATLVDALRSWGERDARLSAALLAAEDAAFGPAATRAAAGEAMLAAIQAYTAGTPANEDAWTR